MKSTVPNPNGIHDLDSLKELSDSTEKPRKANGDNDNVSVKNKKSLHGPSVHETILSERERKSRGFLFKRNR